MTPHDLLRVHPILGALTDGEAQVLLRSARCRMVAAGEIVFLRDDPTDGGHQMRHEHGAHVQAGRKRDPSLHLGRVLMGADPIRTDRFLGRREARRVAARRGTCELPCQRSDCGRVAAHCRQLSGGHDLRA